MATMDVKSFAKYVIDNMHRATLVNALTITNKFGDKGIYDFNEFISYMNEYISQKLSSNTMDKIKAYKLLTIIDDSVKLLNSDIKYMPQMVIDNFIINIWEVFQ